MPATLGIVLFPDFELLDVFGPAEMFGVLPDHYRLQMVGEAGDTVASRQGPRVALDATFADAPQYDLLLVPGGRGTRTEVDNPAMRSFISRQAAGTQVLMTVCTGTALVARTGLLDGRRATSNKMSFAWVCEQGPDVQWVPEARWVEDGQYWTSGGVAAGIDMALALIASREGEATAVKTAQYTEYDWHRDAAWDPFAELAGLTGD